MLLAGSVAAAASGWEATGLGLAAAGALAAAFMGALAALKAALLGEGAGPGRGAWPGVAVDLLAAMVLVLGLSAPGITAPLALFGAVLIGLARLTAAPAPLAPLADRAVLLGLLALAAAFGWLAEASAFLALAFTCGLLLPRRADLG